ncbi:unnamed protein product [Hermetia illucens]|uniref:Uncharacterized protein n=1 Tax=Hermetia illucens TaxID=343691 RepID=A0A7R8YUP7_HERIL|nr:unnamed protein product [Hermetia illucens]
MSQKEEDDPLPVVSTKIFKENLDHAITECEVIERYNAALTMLSVTKKDSWLAGKRAVFIIFQNHVKIHMRFRVSGSSYFPSDDTPAEVD